MPETPTEKLKASVERQRIQREAAKNAIKRAGQDIASERANDREESGAK
jgi:hypothetical protein